MLIDEEAFPLYKGIRTAPAIADLNQDGYFDLVNGNLSGGLNYYSGTETPPALGFSENRPENKKFDFSISPNPASVSIRIDLVNTPKNANILVQIINIYGQEVYHDLYNPNSIRIPLRNLENGIYFCALSTGNTKTTKKMVVAK